MARTLDVYYHRHLAGELIQDNNGDMVFDYAKAWLQNPQAVPLSRSLPLRQDRFTRSESRGFFGGILPEGESRETVARNLGISAKNDFAMLAQIGGDCAGAVTFISPGEKLPEQRENYREITQAELAQILRLLPRRPLLAGEDGIRLSLAGAQNKLAVHISNDQIFLPLGGAPSTHILKPAIERLEGTVANEAFCMKLAQAVGINAANVEVGSAEGIEYLLVERYDRFVLNEKLERLHQEDFCQALGIPPEQKYQNEGGPSLKQCFQLVRETVSVPALGVLSLLDGVIFNYLIGNNDAHGKNFSLLYETLPSGLLRTSLAPFYDLLCTASYPDLSQKMAMKLGGEYDAERVCERHFEALAEEARLGKPMVRRRVQALARMVMAKSRHVSEQLEPSAKILSLIEIRCERMLTNLL